MPNYVIYREVNDGIFSREGTVVANTAHEALKDFVVNDPDCALYFNDSIRFIVRDAMNGHNCFLLKLSVPPRPKWDVVSA